MGALQGAALSHQKKSDVDGHRPERTDTETLGNGHTRTDIGWPPNVTQTDKDTG